MTDPDLAPLIAAARSQPPEKDHVVVYLSNLGIHWSAESRSACDVMAMVLRPEIDCRVLSIAEFITMLEESDKTA